MSMASIAQDLVKGVSDTARTVDKIVDNVNRNRGVTRTSSQSSGGSQSNIADVTERQREIVQLLASGGDDLSSEERNALYAELVSDNLGDNNATTRYNDGTEVDDSEMKLLSKTKLRGEFRTKDKDGTRFEDFGDDPEKGKTKKEVCGGTITYMGTVDWSVENMGDEWWNFGLNMFGSAKGTLVRYEGELGSFTYDTRYFELSYYEAETENGNTISVPALHYCGDKNGIQNLARMIGGEEAGVHDGSAIKIPEGLKIGDYMFADTDIDSMPDISACESLESAHCMFMNCKSMTHACDDALNQDGTVKFPPNLEDMSWIFAGSGMTQFFGELGENVIDARCAAQDCTNMGWSLTASNIMKYAKTGEMENSFRMPDTSKTRWLLGNFCDDMFDNTPEEVVREVEKYCDAHDGHVTSMWIDEEGHHNGSDTSSRNATHDCIFDRIQDGSYEPEKMKLLRAAASRYDLLQMIDPESKGLTGTEAITNGMASSVNHVSDEVAVNNSSTWSTLLQTDRTFAVTDDNPTGELMDRAAAFGVTYGVLKGVTKSNLIAIGVAGAAQIVGVANKITPILDTVVNMVGPDTKVGGFLSKMSGSLKSKDVEFSTNVEDLDIDKVFEKQQRSSLKYAFTQMNAAFGGADIAGANVPLDEDGYSYGAVVDLSQFMRENGRSIARDGNLIVLAMTSEEELNKSLNHELMVTSANALADNLREDAGGSATLSDALKAEYSQYFLTMMGNIHDYSEGALEEVNEKYRWDETDKAAAMNGLEKVMRNTGAPMYETMAQLQQEYHLFSDEQLRKLDEMTPAGMPKFSEYTVGQDLTPESDPYVEALDAQRETLKQALESATTAEEINQAYVTYYETAYASIIREAESQGVALDTKGAQVPGTASSAFSSVSGEMEENAKNRATEAKKNESTTPREDIEVPSETSSDTEYEGGVVSL